MKIRSFVSTTLSALILAVVLQTAALAQMGRVDINSASAEEISQVLVGIGPSKAQAIVAYREEFGQFEDVDELINVRGIGLRTVDQNRDRLSLGAGQP
ncbi:MAG TPA: ComEA family DNA-binding protein [Wenzhouxiangella sp.]